MNINIMHIAKNAHKISFFSIMKFKSLKYLLNNKLYFSNYSYDIFNISNHSFRFILIIYICENVRFPSQNVHDEMDALL